MTVMTETVRTEIRTDVRTDSQSDLHYRRCRWCGSAAEGSRLLCPVCGAAEMIEHTSRGAGTVRRLLGAVGGRDTHTQRCVVSMDEGFIARGTVLNVLPGEIAVGSRVELMGCASRGPARGTYFRMPA